MARIRTIKPEFFSDENIVEMTPLARLFYVSLWCEADREGRLSWKPKTLKMRYLPGDDCDVLTLADELVAAGLIVIYESPDGHPLAEIPSFIKHQVINNRESDSVLAPRVKDACTRVKAEGRKEGKERKEGNPRKNATAPPTKFEITQDMKNWAAKNTPRVNLKTETAMFLDYYRGKGESRKDWVASWRNWMRKAKGYQAQQEPSGQPGCGKILNA